ncbi:MAG: hypothetical protein ACRD4O_06390, partial [Bryobacteraceae bacterium]
LKWPSRIRLRSRFRQAIDGCSLVFICILLGAGNWAHLASQEPAQGHLAQTAKWLNLSIQIGLLALAAIVIIDAVQEAVRVRRNAHRP